VHGQKFSNSEANGCVTTESRDRLHTLDEYRQTGTGSQGLWLRKPLDTWGRNGWTSGPILSLFDDGHNIISVQFPT